MNVLEKLQKQLMDLQIQEQMHKTNAAAMEEARAEEVLVNVKALAEATKMQVEQHRLELEKARIERDTAEYINKKIKESELDPDALKKPPWGKLTS